MVLSNLADDLREQRFDHARYTIEQLLVSLQRRGRNDARIELHLSSRHLTTMKLLLGHIDRSIREDQAAGRIAVADRLEDTVQPFRRLIRGGQASVSVHHLVGLISYIVARFTSHHRDGKLNKVSAELPDMASLTRQLAHALTRLLDGPATGEPAAQDDESGLASAEEAIELAPPAPERTASIRPAEPASDAAAPRVPDVVEADGAGADAYDLAETCDGCGRQFTWDGSGAEPLHAGPNGAWLCAECFAKTPQP